MKRCASAGPLARSVSRSLVIIPAILCLSLGLVCAGLLHAGDEQSATTRPHAAMLRYPDVCADKVVFVYANDLWVVDREGGQASPLASPPGTESSPKFSPDGKWIAFGGNYDGNRDLYVIPVGGGVPRRVTHHPAGENLCDWTADGRLLFSAGGYQGLGPMPKLFCVSPEGGLPNALPVPYGAAGAISPDGAWLAYTPHTRDQRSWKRYRGGMATDIWLFHLHEHQSRKITRWEGTDTRPMWQGDKLYYLSDRGSENKLNIWVYDVKAGSRKQVTFFDSYDIKWPSIGPGPRGAGEIVFQYGAGLWLLALDTGRTREIEVSVPCAQPTLRPITRNAAEFMQSWEISPTGKRAVVQARGDVWTLPAEKGTPRNLTRTSGVAERSPAWSPDGKWIAYFSDVSGEYELHITQSDGKGETRSVTAGHATYFYTPVWSPDSKKLAFYDKAARIFLHTLDDGATKVIDEDPWGNRSNLSWSHDSRLVAYTKVDEINQLSAIWIYNIDTEESTRATSGVFNDSSPAFDRKGDFLYFTSARSFQPSYSDVDSTFIYDDSGVLLAAPLRADIKSPWLPESDEETWDEKDDGKEDAEDADSGDKADEDDGDNDDNGSDVAAAVDEVSGTWEGSVALPEGELSLTITLALHSGGSVTGSFTSPVYSGDLRGSFDPSSKTLTVTATIDGQFTVVIEVTVQDGSMSGTVTVEGDVFPISAQRTSAGAEEDDATDGGEQKADTASKEGSDKEKKSEKDKQKKTVAIDFEDFERRAIHLPVPRGNYHSLAVNDKNQLLYVRRGAGIKLFDINDKKKDEKTVDASARGFSLSADGKKLLVIQGRRASIRNAAAGGSSKRVVADAMNIVIDPREEWRQVFVEAWRIYRDFFYVANMHGVDWPAIRRLYGAMLESCLTREDVSYVIREMIAELNVGHAYYFGGDGEDEPRVSVGLLGVDWELDQGAYRIARIYEGAPWDFDARGPLSQPGVEIHEGDYVHGVNGVPLDPAKDPWAAFVGLSGQTVILTVSDKPKLDDGARDVVIETSGSERMLRYRAWIEHNRSYVDEQTDGRVGYIYVPDTGRRGQNDLVRQYVGQRHKQALIIDERWNGGGQIPSRFIEMLNRPVTNYWAVRHGKDSTTPGDAHHGPKCMLINGLAGSGGDMFPWLFREAGLGKLIGTRTWGGLVGLSGNPGLIDGGYAAVPTFGFYEKDGTWGIEGHGVDPDIEVVDDPALMVGGGDPQLDRAIRLMLQEIAEHPYTPPRRPASPMRSGMGITEQDK